MKKILITGNPTPRNKGCMGMTVGFANALREQISDVDIHVLSYSFSDELEYERKQYERFNINVDTLPWGNNYLTKFDKISFLGKTWFSPYMHKLQIFPEVQGFKRYLESFDLLVDLSGDGISDDYTWKGALQQLSILHMASIVGIPIFVSSQTIGPFKSRISKLKAKKILPLINMVTVREKYSQKYLINEFGLHTQQTVDNAFLLKPEPPKGEYIKVADFLYKKSKPLLGISVSSLQLTWGLKKSISYIAELADDFIDTTGGSVIFIPHVIVDSHDDREAAEMVMKQMLRKENAYNLKIDMPCNYLKWIIGQMDLILAMRMHAAVAATSQGVPVICVGKGIKFNGVIGDNLNLKEYVLDPNIFMNEGSYLDFKKIFFDLLDNLHDVRSKLELVLPNIHNDANMNIKIAMKLLGDK